MTWGAAQTQEAEIQAGMELGTFRNAKLVRGDLDAVREHSSVPLPPRPLPLSHLQDMLLADSVVPCSILTASMHLLMPMGPEVGSTHSQKTQRQTIKASIQGVLTVC